MSAENITVNTQSSIRIAGSKILYFDPYLIGTSGKDADFIFITHAHYDHLDPESIGKIKTEQTVLVAPCSMEQEIKEKAGVAKTVFVKPGDVCEMDGISLEAVPACNKLKPFHPKGNGWVGYIVTMDGVRYYVAGDTDAVKELSAVSCDIALVPIGGHFTMDAKEAAGLINRIRPQLAIPTHYGSIIGKKEDADTFRKYVDEEIAVETRLTW